MSISNEVIACDEIVCESTASKLPIAVGPVMDLIVHLTTCKTTIILC